MSSTVNQLAERAFREYSVDSLTTTVGLVVLALLLALLLWREIAVVLGGGTVRRRALALDCVLAPLLCMFGLIVIARLMELRP
jgi:hypothetical protein